MTEKFADKLQKIEDGVVGTYKKIENGVTGAYQKVEDKFIDTFVAKEGETIEAAKERMLKNQETLDAKMKAEAEKRTQVQKEIANLVMVRLDAGDEMSPEIMERYAAIVEAREVIAELENEKVQTFVTCPNCGAKTSMDMNYCGKCGTNVTEA